MSLRSVGNQLLQTVPSLLLEGASKASAAFWVLVNPGGGVAGTPGVEIFGDTRGVFSATLSGAGILRLQWSTGDGHSSACTVALAPGTSYHVAATWQAGSQQYYLNGVQVGADTQGGSLGLPAGATPRPFRLGSDQAGADVTLDRPVLWVGYALTARDVVGLRDGTAQPGGIAPASIALQWSLAGAGGVAAKVGDAGLADASPSGLALSSIVGAAPTYQAGSLAYVAATTINPAAAPSGESIVLLPRDPSGNPAGVTSVKSSSAVQSIRLSGTPSGNALTLSFNGQALKALSTTTGLPAVYFTWTFPTVAGHSYDLAVTWWTNQLASNQATQQYYYETIDGAATLATRLLTAAVPPDQFTDPGQMSPDGNWPIYWDPVASAVVPSGATLQVRFTGNNTPMVMNGLRVRDRTAGTTTYYDLTKTGNYTYNASSAATGGWSEDANPAFFGGHRIAAGYGGSGIGPATVITPTAAGGAAATLQAALEALAAIPRGDVIVTDLSGLGTGNYQVQFVKGLGNSAQPLLTCTDAAVSIAQVNAGGVGITLTLNGGPPMLLGDRVYTEGAPLPFVQLILPQSAPAVQTCLVNELPYEQSGYWDLQLVDVASSLSGGPVCGWSAGLSMSFPFPLMPPGTYQLAITHPNAPFTRNGDPTQYSPSTATQFLVQDDLGDVLATYSVDQTRAPSSYADANGRGWHVLGSFTTTKSRDGLTLVMTTVGQSAAAQGQVQHVAILDAIQLTRTSPDASVVIGPNDVATLAIPDGWIVTTAGPIPAASGLPVAPPSPTAISPAFVAGPKTMKIGYNTHQASYADNMISHSNLAYLMNTMGTVQDSDGYPTRFNTPSYSRGSAQYIVIANNNALAYGDPPQGTYLVNDGLFVLAWTGDETISLTPSQGTTVVERTVARPSNVAGNWKVYEIRCDPLQLARPCFFLKLESTVQDLSSDPSGLTYAINLSDLQIYPPDPTDPTGNTIWGLNAATNTWAAPPKFHPWYLEKLQAVNCLRFLDPLNTNNNPASEFSHYKPATHANRCCPTLYNKTVGVVQVRPATASEAHYPPGAGPIVVIQTTAPHGLYNGCFVEFSGCGTASFANGGSYPLDTNSTGLDGVVRVIDPTTLLCVIGYAPLVAMTNTTTGGSLIAPGIGTMWPLQDVTDLVAALPTVTDIHFNAAITLDATPGNGAQQVAAFLAAHLRAGVKVHVEPGNECWNGQFVTNTWCALEDSALSGLPYSSLNYTNYYAAQSKAIHDRFSDAFTAAGRGGDVVRLYGTWTANPQVTAAIVAHARANGAVVDEVCIAPYVNEGPAVGYDADQMPVFDRMTTGQVLDYTELCNEYGGWDELLVANQYPVLQQNGYPNAKVIAYEGSMANAVPVDPAGSAPPGTTPSYYLRRNAVRRHPRLYGMLLRLIQKFQDAGLTMWSYFYIGGFTNNATWDTYESGNQQRGTGDPVADAINITNPQAKNQVLSEVGGAVCRWASLVPSTTTTTTTTTTKKTVPGRNGRIGATGFPRGLFRPTRSR